MDAPNFKNEFTAKIAGKVIKFNVLAYRKLTDFEIKDAIQSFLEDKRAPRTIKNYDRKPIEIRTLYGYNDPVNPYDNF